jgi:DNA-binding MarR family transcriptional regulator
MSENESRVLSRAITDEVLIALRRISQSISLHSHDLIKRFGLTSPQLAILRELANGEELTARELSRMVSTGQATLTGILDRLEKRGLILRRRSDVDRRRVLIRITDTCRDLLEQAPPPLQESFIERFGKLRDWEQLMILSALQRLVLLMDAKPLDDAALDEPDPFAGETSPGK